VEGRPPDDDGELRKKALLWRDDLLKLLVAGLPTLLLQQLYKLVADRLFTQPWQALWFVVPLAGVGWVAWQVVVRHRRNLLLRGPMLAFFGVYVALFTIAAQSHLLDWRRDLVGGGAQPPASWLVPARLGDWRYALAAHDGGPEPPDDLLVVTTEPAASLAAGRQRILKLIAVAAASGAKGIAFDFHLQQAASPLDPVLCTEIEKVRSQGMPVIFGLRLHRGETGRWEPLPLAPDLAACLPADALGHVMVLRDLDHDVRLVPLHLGLGGRPALSLRVAALLQGVAAEKLDQPYDGYLQPLPPRREHPILTYRRMEVMRSEELNSMLRGLFILVGEDSPSENFATPSGPRLGVLIHADAIDSLRAGAFFRRSPAWLTFGVIFALCYVVTALAASGAAARTLLRTGLAASVGLVAASAAAAWAARLWVDVVYALVALWLLLALLLVQRGLRGLGARPAS
jgi:CHASE2 domain-containing sensor protein